MLKLKVDILLVNVPVDGLNDKFELTSLIDSLNLSEKQKNYLQIVIANPSLKDTEVAKILGVGRNSISMMKKRIREKISVFGLN